MRFPRVWEKSRRSERADSGPRVVPSGEIEPAAPWSPPSPGVREVRTYDVRPGKPDGGRDWLSGGLLWAAGLIITAALIGAGYVSYRAQELFALAHNGGDSLRATITAALPDAGWAAMALVALVAALRGSSSARARMGVVVFFALSLAAQVAYAPRTVEGVLVAVIAPVTLAWMLESFVVEVRRWASRRRGLDLDESPILGGLLRTLGRLPRMAGRLLLWWVRLFLDKRGTWGGLREWVLDEAPLAPGRTAASLRAQAAIEQAGGVEQAALAERERALAEAEQIKAAARAEAEQTRQRAAAEVAGERQAAEAEIQRARAEAAAQIEQARAEAAARIEQERAQAGEQVNGAHSLAEQQVSAARAEAAEQVRRARTDAEQQVHQIQQRTETELARARRERELLVASVTEEIETLKRQVEEEKTARDVQVRGMHQELHALRTRHERLLAAAPAKLRLIALYDDLREQGDPRWGDRERVAEIARELYERAGLQSEGTARTYLHEHLNSIVGGTVGTAVHA